MLGARTSGRVRQLKLLAAALAVAPAFVAGSASAMDAFSCSMGGGRNAAVLLVSTDSGGLSTCFRFPLLPAAAPAPGALSCHALARRIGCVLSEPREMDGEEP